MTNWIHFTGICGTATGQIAVEYKRNGYLVSGSEKGLYPPMSDYVRSNGINIEIGYKPEHLTIDYYKSKYSGEWNNCDKKYPDEVVFVGTKGSKNEEYVFAKDNQIPVRFYPEILKEKVVIPEKSVVVAGTYGKTTITSMLAWIFTFNGFNISYMFGGLSPNLKNGVRFKDDSTVLSIVEGDEYMISYSDQRSKFFEYSPKYLVLTSAQWDHTDMFKTKQEYLFNFKTLVDSVPEDGLIIYDETDNNIKEFVINNAKARILTYSDFELELHDTPSIDENFKLKIIGRHNQRNAIAAYGMAKSLGEQVGLYPDKIIEALNNYLGLRRRLEVKFRNEKYLVLDDFGSTPHKARVAIDSIVAEFPDKSIYVVFEPNSGSRTARIVNEYQNTFNKPNVKKVFLPRFTQVVGDYLENDKLSEYLQMMGATVEAISDDTKLEEALVNEAGDGGIVIFMGSHGFRGLIDKIVDKLHSAI